MLPVEPRTRRHGDEKLQQDRSALQVNWVAWGHEEVPCGRNRRGRDGCSQHLRVVCPWGSTGHGDDARVSVPKGGQEAAIRLGRHAVQLKGFSHREHRHARGWVLKGPQREHRHVLGVGC